MNKTEDHCFESINSKNMERSPSPEPFKEPDDMVTIDLNRQSPISTPLKKNETNSNKFKRLRVVSYIIVLCLFCLTSFLTAVFIHLDDVKWLGSKLLVVNDQEDIHSLPKSEWIKESSIDQQTCAIDFLDQYKTQLNECEKSQTVSDCCHIFLRSNSPEINDACSVVELLNLLTEYRKLFPRRKKRHYIRNYVENYDKDDIQNKLDSRIKTEKKIMSYLQELDEPLKKEIPALWNWARNLFFKRHNENEMFQFQPVHEAPLEHQNKDYFHEVEGPNRKEFEMLHHPTGINDEIFDDKIISANQQHLHEVLRRIPHNDNTYEANTPYSNKVIETNSHGSQFLPTRSSSPIENGDKGTENQYRIEHVHNFLGPEGFEEYASEEPSLNKQQTTNFQKEYNRNVFSFPEYFRINLKKDVVSLQNDHDINLSNNQENMTDVRYIANERNKTIDTSSNVVQTRDFSTSQTEDFLKQMNPTRENNQHRFMIPSYEKYFKSLRASNEPVELNVEYRRKRELNDIYEEENIPMNKERLTMPDYSRLQENIVPDNTYINDYRNQYNQFDESIIAPNEYYEEKPSPNIAQIIEKDPVVTRTAINNFLSGQENDSNITDTSYHSLSNGIGDRENPERRIHSQTDERNLEGKTWKEFNSFQLPQYSLVKYASNIQNSPLYPPVNEVEKENIKNSYRKTTDLPNSLPTVQTSVENMQERKTSQIDNFITHNIRGNPSDQDFGRKPYMLQVSNISEESPRQTGLYSNGNFLQMSTERSVATVEMSITTTMVPADPLDATDSVQSIDRIFAGNKSVRVDFENTTIVLQERKDKLHISTTDKELDTSTESNEMQKKLFKSVDGNYNEHSYSSDIQRGSSNLEFRGSPQQTDFGPKGKGGTFSGASEDVQSSQNNILNNCVYSYASPFSSPYRYAVSYDNTQLLNVLPPSNVQKAAPVYVINPSVFSYIPPSPIISHYGPINQNYNPYGYVNPIASITNPNNIVNGGVQVASANGQYYLCNPIPTPSNGNVANLHGVEIRRVPNLQKSSDDMTSRNLFRNTTRAALNCPMDGQSCLDGTKCISERQVCDNEVHCDDASDEMFCSCRDRIGEIRLCDGYYDCPDGEDERGCFGCADDEISCDDWSRFRKGTCVLMDQRCDGIRHCDVTGRDEDDCSILTDHMGEKNPIKISNAVGFLHRNFKGKWYPTCFGSELWAMDVCKTEAGPSTIAPKSHLILTSEKYEGEFINIRPNQEMGLVNSCVQGRGAFVECPPLFCGLRMTVKNPYRSQEVDTSIEEFMNTLNRENVNLDESIDSTRNVNERSNGNTKDFLLGNERVVGGKASQPAAWPWVVSIYKNGIFHCGGVIINELWVVTAAHCVDRYWLFHYEVQAGILRRFSFSPMEQTRWVVAAVAHEEYNKSNLKNDIALLKLSSPVRYNRYVRPICLPSETTAGQDFLRGPSPGTICTTVGWGATVEHGTDPDHMREVQVPILKRCKHREDQEGDEICAGLFEGGKDACQGDSGGPFMCQNPNNPNQWYLAGIVSHGEGCARPNEPGVYTRVSQYIGWIADNIRDGNFFPRTPLEKCPGYVCKEMNKCIPKKRRCDKIVDCLMGDDELNCENSFQNIFKHSRTYNPFFRFTEDKEKPRLPMENNIEEIVSASIINAKDESKVTTEILESTTLRDDAQSINENGVIYRYERRHYSNNNTADPDIFRCNRMLQVISIKKRCNKIVDCEDATDEQNCECVDYINLVHPFAICDGIVDCIDGSDEKHCSSCKEEEFNCKNSHMCISLNFRCNGKNDCTHGEDELDCITLTNGKTLSLDTDLRPNLQMNGIVSVNRNGIWRPHCSPANNNTKSDAEIATGVCNYLGYEEYSGFRKLKVYNHSLIIKSDNSMGAPEDKKINSTKCHGLYLWCSNITLNNNAFDVFHNTSSDSQNLYNSPWNALIYAGGIYKCMGALLDNQWVITSGKCFDGILMYQFVYLAVSLGKGLKNLNVTSPHEKILRVIKSVEVNNSDIILLKLEHTVDFSRYIQPTHLSLSSSIADKREEKCMALGLVNGETRTIFLKSNKTCTWEHKCFTSVQESNCSKDIWSGVISCNSGNGWYPASVFQIKDGPCEFNIPTKFTSIKFWAKNVEEATKDRYSTVPSFTCNGYLCKLGNCIERNKICDGIPHCRMAEDEDPTMCRNRDNSCHLNGSCVCPYDHLTCTNGLCVEKEKFCDRSNDCGDYSDEPSLCTCRSYLMVAHPEKVCDGKINCFDRSDEDPRLCPCRLVDFKCGRSDPCVANEMVCDGIKDCPGGEDEINCYSLVANNSTPNVGEVLTKRAGRLSKSCFVETPTRLTLDEICQQFGFTSCIGHLLEQYNEDTNATLIPVSNTFDIVWIRRDRKMPLMYRMRTGNNSHLGFRKQNNCHSLHVECI